MNVPTYFANECRSQGWAAAMAWASFPSVCLNIGNDILKWWLIVSQRFCGRVFFCTSPFIVWFCDHPQNNWGRDSRETMTESSDILFFPGASSSQFVLCMVVQAERRKWALKYLITILSYSWKEKNTVFIFLLHFILYL